MKKRYEIWKNILTKLNFDQNYVVNNDRPDYEEFLDGIRSFAQNYWNFVVIERDNKVEFMLRNPVKCVEELISYYEEHESKNVQSEVKSSRDDFYTKSYDESEISKQKETWDKINEYKLAREAVIAAQTNDLPLSSVSDSQEKNNASYGLKSSQSKIINEINKNEKRNDTEW
jgi:hypothetical protein